jgi:hypothetical protein
MANETGLVERITALARDRLSDRSDLSEPGWHFWERRNLNLHRVVGLWSRPPAPRAEESDSLPVRAALGRHFRRSWWRGLAFGVIVESDEVLLGPEASKELIDGRENAAGTWQWLVQVAPARKVVVGVHTWIEGFLSPLYRGLLDGLAREYQVVSLRKDRDGLMRLLTSVKPGLFPEFRNELGPRPPGA